MRFEFATAGRVLFGPGVLAEAIPHIAAFGRKILVVTGRSAERARALIDGLSDGSVVSTFAFEGEPTVEEVERGVALARDRQIEAVVGFGGGAAIDGAKAVAAMAANEGGLLDYIEIIGRGRPLARVPLPLVAIPTTAGAGAEATRNAVLTSRAHGVKASLRSPRMLPRLAVVDPALTLGLPRELTASTGLDAMTQLIEPLVSIRANPLTDGFCREGLPRAARSLARAWAVPDDLGAREDMALASLLGGMALANAGLGVVHGFAAPIGGMFPAPHGAVCAALLPHAMDVNVRACRERNPDGPALARFAEVARLVCGRAEAGASDAVAWVRDLCAKLAVPPLRRYGVREVDVPAICLKASEASSMKGNPIPLQPEELAEILTRAL